MPYEREIDKGEPIINPDFTVFGKGNIGEKARQLIVKTPELKSLGFAVPHRTLLAEGFFNRFFQRNGIASTLSEVDPNPQVASSVLSGSFPLEDFGILQRIGNIYGDIPIMVRSSAEGDARGTGTYRSDLVHNNVGEVRKALQRVLASYFSSSAIAFRRDALTGEGFGVIIEPVIGQQLTRTNEYSGSTHQYFAPVLSGFGYTSTLKGEGYINAVPGLGGGVETKDGLKIKSSDLKPGDGNLIDLILDDKWLDRYRNINRRDKPLLLGYDTEGQAYMPPNQYRRRGTVYQEDMKLWKNDSFNKLNIHPFFEMMSGMEQAFGIPQYFEWAMTLEGDQPEYWILQIADVDKKIDNIEFEDYGDVLLTANNVTGSGIVEANKLANCWNPTDIDALHEFNKKNKGYVLLYSSRLTTVGGGRYKRLSYGDFSNASVFIEIQDAAHAGDPVAHLGTQLDMAKKTFRCFKLLF